MYKGPSIKKKNKKEGGGRAGGREGGGEEVVRSGAGGRGTMRPRWGDCKKEGDMGNGEGGRIGGEVSVVVIVDGDW